MAKLLPLLICLLGLATGLQAQRISCVTGAEFSKRFRDTTELTRAEEHYCAEFGENAKLRAIYGFSLNIKHGQILRVFEDHSTFTWYEDDTRFHELELTEQDLKKFQSIIRDLALPFQESLNELCIDTCSAYQFLQIDRGKGSRIPIMHYYWFPPKPLDSLGDLFREWRERPATQTKYYLQKSIPEARLLVSDNEYAILSFWKSGRDQRVLISDRDAPGIAQEWRSLTESGIGRRADQPKDTFFLHPINDDSCGRSMMVNHYSFERRLGDSNLCVGGSKKAGLWIVKNKSETRLVQGEYDSPVVTKDQGWIIASKGDSEKPWKSIVRINTTTKKEYGVDISKADCIYPSHSLPGSNQVLIVRCRANFNPSPDPPKYYILDPASGNVRPVTGEIRPIMYQQYRYLQTSNIEGQFWAAVPNEEKGSTDVGLYDPKKLSFKILTNIPSIIFFSSDLFVDETDGFIFIVYKYELLRLPLPKTRT